MRWIEEGTFPIDGTDGIVGRIRAQIRDSPARMLTLIGELAAEARDRIAESYESAKGADELIRQANMALDVVIILCERGQKIAS